MSGYKLHKIILLCLLVDQLALRLGCTQSFTAVHTKIHDRSVVEEFNFTLVACNDRNAMSGRAIYKTDLINVHSTFKLDFERGCKSTYNMINIKIDNCKFLEDSYKRLNIASVVLEGFKKMRNFPRHCPVKAYTPLELECFEINWKTVSIYLPSLNFSATLKFHVNGKIVAELIIKGSTT